MIYFFLLQQPEPVTLVSNLFLPGGFELARYADSKVNNEPAKLDMNCDLSKAYYSVMLRQLQVSIRVCQWTCSSKDRCPTMLSPSMYPPS